VPFLPIELVGCFVLAVDFPEQSFQLSDFGFRNIGPNFEGREMCPKARFVLVSIMAGKPAADASTGHADIEDVVFVSAWRNSS
jgi:hypothetical protein